MKEKRFGRIAMRLIKTGCLVLFLFIALAGWLSPAAQAQEKDGVQWKVGTLAPKGIGWANQVARILVPAVRDASDGHVSLKVFWGGAVGDDKEILAKMRKNRLQAGGLTALGATLACPEMAILQLPFLFNNYDEVDCVREHIYPEFERHMKKNGFHLWIWVDQDFDKVYSVDKKLRTLADFTHVRFATWHDPIEERVFTSLGAVAVPVTIPELPATIKSGKADALLAPAIWMVGAQMHSAVRYVTPLSIRYSPSVIIVTQDAWQALPKNYRDRATAMRARVTSEFTQAVRMDNKKYFDAMIQYGVQKVNMPPHDVMDLRLKTAPVWEEMAGKAYPRELLDQITSLLKQCRNPGH